MKLLNSNPIRKSMGRKGDNLTSYEDSDMAFTACDLGYGIGLFVNLKLKHLIPKERLTEKYFIRLLESSAYSGTIVESFRGKYFSNKKSLLGNLADYFRFLRMSKRQKRLYLARKRGLQKALNTMNKL